MNELKELEAGIINLKKSSVEQKRLIKELEKERERLIEKSEILNKKLKESHEAFEKTVRKIMEFVKDQINETRMEIANIERKTERISELERELKKQQTLLNSLSSSDSAFVQHISSEINRIGREIELQKKHIETVRTMLLESVEKSLTSQLKELQKESKRLSSLEQNLESTKKYIEKRLDDINTAISNLNSQYQARDANNQKSLAELNKTIEHLSSNLEKEQQTIQELQKKFSTAITKPQFDQALKPFLFQIKELQKESSSFKKRFEEITTRISNLNSEYQAKDANNQKSLIELNKAIENLEQKLSDIRASLSSEQKEIADLEKASEKRFSSLEQSLISLKDNAEKELNDLNKSISALEKRTEFAITKPQFDKTIKSLISQIKELSSTYHTLDKLLSQTKTDLQNQINSILSDERLTKTLQKEIKQSLERESEKMIELKSEIENLASTLNATKRDVLHLQKTLADMSNIITEREFAQTVTSISKRIDKLEEKQHEMEKLKNLEKLLKIAENHFNEHISSLTETVKVLNDRISTQENEIAKTQQQVLDENQRFTDMINEQRRLIDEEIAKGIDRFRKEFEIREIKLKEEREEMLKRTEELNKYAENILNTVKKEKEKISQMEKEIILKINKENEQFMKKVISMQEETKRKLKDTEKSVMLMNEMLAGVKSDMEAMKEQKLEKKFKEFKENVESTMKMHKEMTDSAIEELRKKLDILMKDMISWKEYQQSTLYKLLKED